MLDAVEAACVKGHGKEGNEFHEFCQEPTEDKLILEERKRLKGNKWQQISKKLPGRTRIDVQNRWHNLLSKQVTNDDIPTTTNVKHKQNNALLAIRILG
tara:strand:+ start:208 stop:504 length:297 start_codon:yes stop_codon:yes gene_type:complete